MLGRKFDRMQMIRHIAAIVGIAGLGVIAAEAINHAHWLAFRLHPAYLALPMTALYLAYEITIRKVRRRKDRGEPAARVESILLGASRTIYIVLGALALLGIPLLWWGVIKRLAASAGEGIF